MTSHTMEDQCAVGSYMLLIFHENDTVLQVHSLQTEDAKEAARLAERLAGNVPLAAGYQVWSNGNCVVSTYPKLFGGQKGAKPSQH